MEEMILALTAKAQKSAAILSGLQRSVRRLFIASRECSS